MKKKVVTMSPLFGIPIILLGVFLFGFYKINVMVHFPNEISYWANAAAMLGQDWSGIASRYSYFSFGYSFLLVPLMALLDDPILLYKMAVLLNVLMACLHGMVLYAVLRRMFSGFGKGVIELVCLMGAVYPSILFYMNVTLPEIMLNLLFVLAIYLLYEVIQKPGKYHLYLLIALWSVMYFVHMRTIGVLAAGGMVLVLFFLQDRKNKRYWIVFGIAALLLISGYVLKSYLEGTLYTFVPKSTLAVNDYGGQIQKIKGLFTLTGIKNLAMSIIGKLYYLGTATFGTFYWGVYSLIKKSLQKDKVSLSILLSVVLSFMVHAFYMSGPGRIDTLMYGRYNEMFVPVVLCIGVMEMIQSAHVLKGVIAQIMAHSVMTMLLFNYIFAEKLETFFGHYVVGFLYFVSGNEPTVAELIKGTYLSGSMLSLLLVGIVLLYQKNKKCVWLLGILVGINVLVGVSACYRYQIYVNQDVASENVELARKIEEITTDNRSILFLDSEVGREIDYMQFCMPEKTILIEKEKDILPEALKEDEFVMTYWDSERTEELKGFYGEFLQQGHFNCYYNR